jgi:hypothetical protein
MRAPRHAGEAGTLGRMSAWFPAIDELGLNLDAIAAIERSHDDRGRRGTAQAACRQCLHRDTGELRN